VVKDATVQDGTVLDSARDTLQRARDHVLGLQHAQGWWQGELETNVTMDAEDLLLREFLGLHDDKQIDSAARWIRSQQRADGTWANFFGGPGDLSTTVEAYVALRLAGDQPDAPHMRTARSWILAHGGVEATRVFTRIWLALSGQWSWDELPVIPPELIYLPSWFPLNIYDWGCWARQTIVALAVVQSFRPSRPLAFTIDELRSVSPGGTTPPNPPPLTGGLPAPPYPPGPPSGGTDPSAPSSGGTDSSVPSSGRIWIRGPVLFSRYRGDMAGTEVVHDGWFRTGDLGQVDASGRLTVRGRADDVINTGGHKVVPGEVAAVLGTCPGVQDVAVVGQPDVEWGERVIAVVVPADRADPPTLELLRLHVRQRLPRYASPSRVVIVDAVPMLPSGKHDIARLKLELLRREQTEAENVT